ncbi:Armadillo repeat-containing protein 2 [Lucilia cuprina]|nr:Armadillo repeat-containing protein 2 [Lucilia cuprina]
MESKKDSKSIGKLRFTLQNTQNVQLPQLEHSLVGLCRRRTSAEMISEAKTFLTDVSPTTNTTTNHNQAASVGGVRVVSTRRPITPRETGRVLYGKVTLPGRPPSAFSLRYLQNVDSRGSTPKTPSLEPLPATEERKGKLSTPKQLSLNKEIGDYGGDETYHTTSRRSQSLESRFDCYESNNNCNALGGKSNNSLQIQTKSQLVRKLPALEIKGVSMNAKDNVKQTKERAKTAYKEAVTKQNEALNLMESSSKDNCSINLLTTRKILTRSNDLLGQSSTEKLIDMLKEHAGLKECTEETASHINSILTELYNRVRKNEKHFKKGFILGGLYGLVESSSAKILLAVARVVLALRVSGSNLTGACKLIFKVARSEQNDYLFYDSDLLELLIDGLGRASPLEDPEACIYGYGSIRFLTCSTVQERAELTTIKDFNRNWSEQFELPRKPSTAPNLGEGHTLQTDKQQKEFVEKLSKQDALVVRLSRHGAVQLMILHLQMLNEAGATQKLNGPPLHSLYQLSAALRALADVRQISSSLEQLENPNFNTTKIQLELACPHLVRAAEVTIGEIEVQANIVRTLSVLSEDPDCCHILTNFAGRIGMLLGPCCANFKSNQAEKLLSLISRLGYILGNIMAKYDNARIQFYHNDVAMEYLLNILEIYSKEPLTLHNSLGDTVVDVLIKMIRVLANMSVNSEVGFGLGNAQSLGNILMILLKASQQIKSIKMKQELQELTHATLGALHNLCFYQDKITSTPAHVIESKGSLQSVLSDLAAQLCSILKTNRDEVTQTEITRVLGNLTRNEKARKSFCKSKGLKLVVEILANDATRHLYDLKACTIGILVNLLGDMENRLPLIQLKGPEILLELLRDALQQHSDWFLATIISQAFWNLFIDTPHIEDVCSEVTLDELSDILAEYLDEEKILKNYNNESLPQMWEDFAIVSTDLLERLQSNYDQQSDSIVSLEASDFENDEDDVYIEGM